MTADDVRTRLLRLIWQEVPVAPETVTAYAPAARAVAAGASPVDVAAAMTASAYETAFRLHARTGASVDRLSAGLAVWSADACPNR
jgi:hypothetical protein